MVSVAFVVDSSSRSPGYGTLEKRIRSVSAVNVTTSCGPGSGIQERSHGSISAFMPLTPGELAGSPLIGVPG
eukprot:4236869-Amphidinium_carterae.1